jgi:hypothetical protein
MAIACFPFPFKPLDPDAEGPVKGVGPERRRGRRVDRAYRCRGVGRG